MNDTLARGVEDATRHTSRAWIGWALGIAIAAWLLSPLASSQHLEGYTANLRAITLAWDRGELATQDTYMPLLTEFLYSTRPGMILLLRTIHRTFGEVGDAGFRGLIIASFLVLATCSVVTARRWSDLPLWCCLLAFLSVPGLSELGFIFNDNIVSAAFGIAALALVSYFDRLAAHAAAGALLGMAILCRTDAALLLPVLAGFAWLRHPGLRPLTLRAAATLAGLTLLLLLGYEITGVTPLDSLRAARGFVPTQSGRSRVAVGLLFFGAHGVLLLAIGGIITLRQDLLRRRDLKWILVFVLYPTVVLGIAVLRLGTELRYIYPLLAPVYLVHAGRALQWMAALLPRAGWRRRTAAALLAVLALMTVLSPITFVRDGPHSLVGRIWMPVLWFRWQASVARSLRRVEDVASAAQSVPRTLVLSTHFNDDFFLKLRLMEAGFRPVPPNEVFPGCSQGFSAYVRPGHAVLHIRTENQYGLMSLPHTAARALQIQRALRCPEPWRFDQAFVTVVGRDIRAQAPPIDPTLFGVLTPRLGPPERLSMSLGFSPAMLLGPSEPAWPDSTTPIRRWFGEVHVMPLSLADLRSISDSADRIMEAMRAAEGAGHFGYEDFDSVYSAHWIDRLPKTSVAVGSPVAGRGSLPR